MCNIGHTPGLVGEEKSGSGRDEHSRAWRLTYYTHFLVETLPEMGRGTTNTVRTHGEKAEGLQIMSIICDTRYLRHPRLSDGSRGGVRILVGPRGGPKRFPLHIWPDNPSLRELVASTAPPETQDPRSWITL